VIQEGTNYARIDEINEERTISESGNYYDTKLVKNARERVFIVGHLTEPGRSGSKIFPIGESGNVAAKEELTVYTLDANYYKGQAKQSRTMIQQVNNPVHSQDRIYSTEGISPCLNSTDGGNQQPFILCDSGPGRKDQLRDETIPPLRANTGAGHNNIICHSTLPRSSKSGKGGTGHLQRDDGISYCVDAANNIAIETPSPEIIKCLTGGGHSGGHHSDMTIIRSGPAIRRLTPIECERLQGFPDNWTEGISDTQRYKCLGNAVSVPVIEFIAKHILTI